MNKRKDIYQIAHSAMQGNLDLEEVKNRITEIESTSSLSHKNIYAIVDKCYEDTINETLDTGVISESQEDAILELINWVELSEEDVYKDDRYMRFIKSCVIRELLEGKIPTRVKPNGVMPFNFQKSETLVWLFNPCHFFQRKTTTIRKGGHAGVSLKIMKGVYFRTGGFSSRPVTSESVVYFASGLLAVTDKHVYFYSPKTAFRIPYRKIIAFTPYKDGVTIHKDTKEKPFIFQTGDGWFSYNLFINLSQL